MTATSLVKLAVVLLVAGAAGTLALLRLFRAAAPAAEADERAALHDAAGALGPLFGLLVFALPGWTLQIFAGVPMTVVLAAGGIALTAVVAVSSRERTALRRALLPGGLVLLVVALAFLWLRSWPGEIRQTEKPMDFAILSGLMTTPTLPFGDPWLAGERLPYYHFGSFLFALPMRLAGVAPEYAYNLVAALVAGLAAAAAFAAVRLRGGGRGVAVFAAVLLTGAGTLDGVRQALGGTRFWEADLWASSRRVQNAITEWPLFTLWLGDLHPHALGMPLLVALAGTAGRLRGLPGLVLDSTLVAALVSANPWDLPAALIVLGAGSWIDRPLRVAFARAVGAAAGGLLLALPALLAPKPPSEGLRLAAAFTTSPEAFLHFGALLAIPAFAFGVALARSRAAAEEAFLAATAFPALGIALAVASKRPLLGLGLGFLAGVAYLALSKLSEIRIAGAVRAGFFLAGAGVLLVSIPEVLVVRDGYGEDLHRMNTIFKTWHGGALLFALGSALLLPVATSSRRAAPAVWVALALLGVGVLPHPATMAAAWLRGAASGPRPTLDGLAWLSREYPGDRKVVEWLRRNAPPRAVIAEAPGTAYEDRSRIGNASGRPTVLGWTNHQGVWRGNRPVSTGLPADREVAAREADLRALYTSTDAATIAAVVTRRKIAYVVVGPLERKTYGEAAFPVGVSFRPTFAEDGTAVYAIGKPLPSDRSAGR